MILRSFSVIAICDIRLKYYIRPIRYFFLEKKREKTTQKLKTNIFTNGKLLILGSNYESKSGKGVQKTGKHLMHFI